jgi:hypothetical protein
LRRVAEPEALRDYASIYRLFPGQPLDDRHLRLAFLLPKRACCRSPARPLPTTSSSSGA